MSFCSKLGSSSIQLKLKTFWWYGTVDNPNSISSEFRLQVTGQDSGYSWRHSGGMLLEFVGNPNSISENSWITVRYSQRHSGWYGTRCMDNPQLNFHWLPHPTMFHNQEKEHSHPRWVQQPDFNLPKNEDSEEDDSVDTGRVQDVIFGGLQSVLRPSSWGDQTLKREFLLLLILILIFPPLTEQVPCEVHPRIAWLLPEHGVEEQERHSKQDVDPRRSR